MGTPRVNVTVLGAAVLLACAGTSFAQLPNRTAQPMRTCFFANPVATPAPSPMAPAAVAAPRAVPAMQAPSRTAAAIASSPRRGSSGGIIPVASVPSGNGGAALPSRQNIMPRNTGAGLAPTQVVVPEYTVLPPGRRPVYDTPLPPRVDPRGGFRPAPGIDGAGVIPPAGAGGGAAPNRQGTFYSASLGSSGFSANVLVNEDNFRFAAHLGSVNNAWYRPCWTSNSWCEPCRPPYAGWCGTGWGGYYPYWGWNSWPGYYYPTYSYTLPVTSASSVMYQDPNLSSNVAQAPSAPALSEFERASLLMQDRRFAEAATAFRAALKADPGDAPARRWLGISMLLLGRTQDGAAEISRAYATDPDLADTSPDLEAMGLTVRQMSDLCAPVITYAKRVNSSAGYVTAAMLMQIRSRPDLAAKMLDSARVAGLDSTVLVRLNQAMTR